MKLSRARIVALVVGGLMLVGVTAGAAVAGPQDVACTITDNVLSCPLPVVAPVTSTETTTATETATVTPDPVTTTATVTPAPVTSTVTVTVSPTTTTPTPTTTPTTTTPATTSTTSPPPASLNCMPVPSVCGFPDSTNTGPHGALTQVTGNITLSIPGQVYENINLRGTISVRADNVTIRNVTVTSNDYWPIRWYSGKNGLITDSTVIGGPVSMSSLSGNGYTAQRVNVTGAQDGIKVDSNVTITDSYIHDLAVCSGCHNDGMESNGNYQILHHNTVVNAQSEVSAIALFQDYAAGHDNAVTDNLLAGGGFTLYAGGGSKGRSSNITITGNHFSRTYFPQSGYYGYATAFDAGGAGNVWSGNVWDDTGKTVPLP